MSQSTDEPQGSAYSMFKSVALIGLGIVFGLIFAGISDGNTGNSEPVESGAETENVDSMFSNISEIIMVVDDLDAAMQVQWEEFGIGPWAIWTFDSSTVNDMMMHDRPQDFAVRIGYAKIGDIYWELVEPLDTHSTYYETLRDHGPSLHNIVFEVRDYDETIERMSQLGIGIFNSGNWGGVRFVNFDSKPTLPVIAEIFDTPEGVSFPEPERVYPPK